MTATLKTKHQNDNHLVAVSWVAPRYSMHFNIGKHFANVLGQVHSCCRSRLHLIIVKCSSGEFKFPNIALWICQQITGDHLLQYSVMTVVSADVLQESYTVFLMNNRGSHLSNKRCHKRWLSVYYKTDVCQKVCYPVLWHYMMMHKTGTAKQQAMFMAIFFNVRHFF